VGTASLSSLNLTFTLFTGLFTSRANSVQRMKRGYPCSGYAPAHHLILILLLALILIDRQALGTGCRLGEACASFGVHDEFNDEVKSAVEPAT